MYTRLFPDKTAPVEKSDVDSRNLGPYYDKLGSFH